MAGMGSASRRETLRRLASNPWLRPFNNFDAIEDFLKPLNLSWSLTRIRARIVERRMETPDCCTFILRPNQLWDGFIAGQHVGVEVEINGRMHVRRYSLTSDAATFGDIAITVKRQAGGRVSNWLFDHGAVDSLLTLKAPEGDFVLPQQLPQSLLMISAGSGITPMYAMLLELKNRRYSGSIKFIHVCRDQTHAIFAGPLQALTVALPGLSLQRIETASSGHPDVADLLNEVPDYAQRLTLLCGPEGLMAPIRKRWAAEGLSEKLLSERFSAVAPPAENASEVKISCVRSGKAFEASTVQTLLLSAESAGLSPKNGCRSGICHTCRYQKRSGRVLNVLHGTHSDEPNEMIQLCVSVPCSDIELEDL